MVKIPPNATRRSRARPALCLMATLCAWERINDFPWTDDMGASARAMSGRKEYIASRYS